MDTNNIEGGWSSFAALTKEDEKIFNKAIEGFVGTKLTPEMVSYQIVAGKNYCFICKAESVTHLAREYYASVTFYLNLDGEIENLDIVDLSVNETLPLGNEAANTAGGYIAHEIITDNDRAVFEYVKKSLIGVDYDLKAVATQVVNGINYKFICISKIVVPYAQPELVMIEVYTKFAHSVAPTVKIKKITKL